MPELPEVENIKISLSSIVNKPIHSVDVFNDSILYKKTNHLFRQSSHDFVSKLSGSTIVGSSRIGKYLLLNLNNNAVLVTHFGMSGFFIFNYAVDRIFDKYKRNIHVALHFDDFTLFYSDLRRFGGMTVISNEECSKWFSLHNNAPDPFSNSSFDYFINSFNKYKNKDIFIKNFIMDSSIISGVGNIYACESLWLSNIRPDHLLSNLNNPSMEFLYNNIKDCLEKSISLGGCTISDYYHPDGSRGTYQNHLNIYNKDICPRCGNKVFNIKIKNRSSYFCSVCQK